MTKEEFEDLVTLFRNKEHELEGVILKSQFILENFLPLMNHLIEMTEANKKLEAENNTLRERIRELEIVEESLGRNIADTAFCPLCLLKDCPQYHKGDLGMGAFDPESVDREQCKKSILAHAEKGAKEARK